MVKRLCVCVCMRACVRACVRVCFFYLSVCLSLLLHFFYHFIVIQHRSAEEERSTVNAELQERLSKIDKLKKRYEILMVAMKPPEGEEEQSQVWLKSIKRSPFYSFIHLFINNSLIHSSIEYWIWIMVYFIHKLTYAVLFRDQSGSRERIVAKRRRRSWRKNQESRKGNQSPWKYAEAAQCQKRDLQVTLTWVQSIFKQRNL